MAFTQIAYYWIDFVTSWPFLIFNACKYLFHRYLYDLFLRHSICRYISDSQADGSFCLGIKSCVIQHTFSYWKKISYLLDMQIPATSSFCNSSASICETILLITNKEKVQIE